MEYLKLDPQQLPSFGSFHESSLYFFGRLAGPDGKTPVVIEFNHRNDRKLDDNLMMLMKFREIVRDQIKDEIENDPRLAKKRRNYDLDGGDQIEVDLAEQSEVLLNKLKRNELPLNTVPTKDEKQIYQTKGHWSPMRIRFDKKWANGFKTALSVKNSLDNPILAEDLILATSHLKKLFKQPEAQENSENSNINQQTNSYVQPEQVGSKRVHPQSNQLVGQQIVNALSDNPNGNIIGQPFKRRKYTSDSDN